jgi:hypothetical protein
LTHKNAKRYDLDLHPISIGTEFPNEPGCLAYLETIRWPRGVRCVKCGKGKVSTITAVESRRSKKYVSKRTGEAADRRIPARRLYHCLNPECRYQFSVRSGTIFSDSHLPLRTWFFAVAIMMNAEKGISALQLKRDLQIGYESAWYLCHRLREAMESGAGRIEFTSEEPAG